MTSISDIQHAFSYAEPKRYDPYPRSHAAVLIPLIERDGELHVVFQVRSSKVMQAGDACFPGGHCEPGETYEQTALRETEEELRIPQQSIRILGPGHEFWSPSRRVVRSFIGLLDPSSDLTNFDPQEVSEIFTVPLEYLMNATPEVFHTSSTELPEEGFPYDRIAGGRNYGWLKVRTRELFYEYQGRTIWGLTAELLKAFMDELKANEK